MARIMVKTATKTITLDTGITAPTTVPTAVSRWTNGADGFTWDNTAGPAYPTATKPSWAPTTALTIAEFSTTISGLFLYTGPSMFYGANRVWALAAGDTSAIQTVSSPIAPNASGTPTVTYTSGGPYPISLDSVGISNLSNIPVVGILAEYNKAKWTASDLISGKRYYVSLTTNLNTNIPPFLSYMYQAPDGVYPVENNITITGAYPLAAYFKNLDSDASLYPYMTFTMYNTVAGDYSNIGFRLIKWRETLLKNEVDAGANFSVEDVVLSDTTDMSRMAQVTGSTSSSRAAQLGIRTGPYGRAFCMVRYGTLMSVYVLNFNNNTYEELIINNNLGVRQNPTLLSALVNMDANGHLYYYDGTTLRQSAYITNPAFRSSLLDSGAKVVFPIHVANHWFYVVRLGNEKSFVYSPESKSWYRWTDKDEEYWTPSIGYNWLVGGKNIPVVGSDNSGQLYTLNPTQPYDEDPATSDELYFDREVSGEVVQQGRKVTPCYSVFSDVRSSEYAGTVTLLYSDDFGQTWKDAGALTNNPANVRQEFSWRSLGLIEAPGRIFKIVDDGAITSVTGIVMNDD
jgi:hypothetical protein